MPLYSAGAATSIFAQIICIHISHGAALCLLPRARPALKAQRA